jgi:hypothetical protein
VPQKQDVGENVLVHLPPSMLGLALATEYLIVAEMVLKWADERAISLKQLNLSFLVPVLTELYIMPGFFNQRINWQRGPN